MMQLQHEKYVIANYSAEMDLKDARYFRDQNNELFCFMFDKQKDQFRCYYYKIEINFDVKIANLILQSDYIFDADFLPLENSMIFVTPKMFVYQTSDGVVGIIRQPLTLSESAYLALRKIPAPPKPLKEKKTNNLYRQFADIPASSQNSNSKKLLFDHCSLKDLDPWDPLISKYFNPSINPIKNCKLAFEQITVLIDGQLFVTSPRTDITCWRRCLMPKTDYLISIEKWIKVVNGTRPACDIFEIECLEYKNRTTGEVWTFYKYMHSQTYRKPPQKSLPPSPPPPSEKPDVHIILFDSVSHSQFIRSMTKTSHFLKEFYDSISFRYLNKVGLNSRPNGHALLMGKSAYPIAESPVSRGYKTDYPNESYCEEYLDDDQFIGYRFQDDGYVSLMSEDWAYGVFNWPNCWGFGEKPVDHYMRPFQIRVEGYYDMSPDMASKVYNGSCKEEFHHQIDYLKDFLRVYPDKPKFSITWMSYLAHNDANGLFHSDDYFYQFFKDYKEKFSNSFLFVMGDHGNRFGKVRDTPVGEGEDNNPFLFLSVPERLRDNLTLINTIKKNSRKLMTHYDLYATMLEMTNPSEPRISNPIIKGNSIFHPLPEPRTCDALRIPFEYCICEKRKTRLPSTNLIGSIAAEMMIAQMNENLLESNSTSECAELELNSEVEITVDEFEDDQNDVKIYQVSFTTSPGDGEFWGFVIKKTGKKEKKGITILSEKFPRLNSYADQAKCASTSKFASYCYCKNLELQTTPSFGENFLKGY